MKGSAWINDVTFVPEMFLKVTNYYKLLQNDKYVFFFYGLNVVSKAKLTLADPFHPVECLWPVSQTSLLVPFARDYKSHDRPAGPLHSSHTEHKLWGALAGCSPRQSSNGTVLILCC